ncbi:hypothetical protein GIB67_033132 [Kingdonia uniflora]|uniref:FBD domain-containing protein n=1 Tax=Kingdonia uniflora TaxID=39325 RepID=A0A7J7MP42_9MAGN|nr:hypothetical protein GIB67_033132 [Kingdonia uniflora]
MCFIFDNFYSTETIFSSFPALETLVIKECDFSVMRYFTIFSLKLKSLTIQLGVKQQYWAKGLTSGLNNVLFRISAPALVSASFEFDEGSRIQECIFENLHCLMEAHVRIRNISYSRQHIISQILEGLRYARSLTMDAIDFPVIRHKVFHEVKVITLYTHTVLTKFSKYVSFDLWVVSTQCSSSAETSVQTEAESSHNLLQHLKSVEICGFRRIALEIELVSFLLKNAAALKKLNLIVR